MTDHAATSATPDAITRHTTAARHVAEAISALVREWDDGQDALPAAALYPFHESCDEIAERAWAYVAALEAIPSVDGMSLDAALALFMAEYRRVGGFHPEDDPADMQSVRDADGNLLASGERVPTFTPSEAYALTVAIGKIYAAGIDCCTLTLAAYPQGIPPRD